MHGGVCGGGVVVSYIPPPRGTPPAFPNLVRSNRKTPVQGGGALRARWKDERGNIYEWDSLHGTIEKYNRRGKHLGEFDPATGEQLSEADATKTVEP